MTIKLNKWMKRTIIAVAVIGLLLWGCASLFEHMQNVDEGYQRRFDYKGELEKKYAANGEYTVDTLTAPSAEERIKLLQFYFPAELKTAKKQ